MNREKETSRRKRAFVFFLPRLQLALTPRILSLSRSLVLALFLSLYPNRNHNNSAILLGCFSRCTSPFTPCCKAEHDAFWACYREKRGGGGRGSKKISVLPFPSSSSSRAKVKQPVSSFVVVLSRFHPS